MKIGIISDTHDRLTTMRQGLQELKRREVDAVLHPGDYVAPFAAKLLVDPEVAPTEVPLHCIFGNNDGEREGLKKTLPQLQDGPWRGELGGRSVVMHHWVEWFKPRDLEGADIVISGHTHEVVREERDGKLFINPGECCGWLHGRCTVAVLDTDDLAFEVIELTP